MAKVFICKGENFRNGYGVGFCGTIKTLRDWILTLFSHNALDFFKDDDCECTVGVTKWLNQESEE